MAGVYTERLFSGVLAERAAFVVPAGAHWVLRDITVYANVASHSWVSIKGAGYVMSLELAPSGGVFYGHWVGRQVAYGGEELDVWSVPAGAELLCTGYSFK